MASKKKIVQLIASIKAIYPYYAKESDLDVLVSTWTLLLKEMPDNVAEASFFKCLQSCKMPPTPADVLEHIREMSMADEPSDEALWSDLMKAISKTQALVYQFPFTCIEVNGKTQGDNARDAFDKLWDSLPEQLRMFLGSKGELIRISNYDETDLKYEKTRFLKTMPTIHKRREYNDMRLMIAGGTDKLLESGQ